jgi:hypothetical protein
MQYFIFFIKTKTYQVPFLFPRVGSGRGVKLTTHLHIAPKLRMPELHLHLPLPSS